MLDPLVDQETSDYWNQPKKTLGDSVIEPYLYDGLLMTSYTSPVERAGKFVGIGGVDVSLKRDQHRGLQAPHPRLRLRPARLQRRHCSSPRPTRA